MATATRTRRMVTAVLPMTLDHLGPLGVVVERAHRRMRHPDAAADYTPARTLRLLALGLRFPTTAAWLLLDGNRIIGYCWAEHVRDVHELHVHELYLDGGYPWQPLWRVIERAALERSCKRITGIMFRRGAARVVARVGFVPRGTYFVKELS